MDANAPPFNPSEVWVPRNKLERKIAADREYSRKKRAERAKREKKKKKKKTKKTETKETETKEMKTDTKKLRENLHQKLRAMKNDRTCAMGVAYSRQGSVHLNGKLPWGYRKVRKTDEQTCSKLHPFIYARAFPDAIIVSHNAKSSCLKFKTRKEVLQWLCLYGVVWEKLPRIPFAIKRSN